MFKWLLLPATSRSASVLFPVASFTCLAARPGLRTGVGKLDYLLLAPCPYLGADFVLLYSRTAVPSCSSGF